MSSDFQGPMAEHRRLRAYPTRASLYSRVPPVPVGCHLCRVRGCQGATFLPFLGRPAGQQLHVQKEKLSPHSFTQGMRVVQLAVHSLKSSMQAWLHELSVGQSVRTPSHSTKPLSDPPNVQLRSWAVQVLLPEHMIWP